MYESFLFHTECVRVISAQSLLIQYLGRSSMKRSTFGTLRLEKKCIAIVKLICEVC